MAIYIVDGYRGHGKTVWTVNKMRKLINAGERIFSDIKLYPEKMDLEIGRRKIGFMKYEKIPLNIEGQLSNKADRDNPAKRILYWSHFDEWQYLKSGTILCDEGGVKFNARRFDALPDEIQNKLMQLRHERLDLYLTAPHHSRIDLMIRQNTEKFYHMQLIMGSPKFERGFLPRITSVWPLQLEEILLVGTPQEGMIKSSKGIPFYIRPKMFQWYDTSKVVTEGRPMPLRKLCKDHLKFYCPECDRLNMVQREMAELDNENTVSENTSNAHKHQFLDGWPDRSLPVRTP